ncbi:MAG: chromosomal replication initiator protein DnaA [Candidatus Jacksonbacteria bacterium]|nr:chromosomal replication initiator protein DnaA [Candidatus Jacksonbacteria bacterium]
MLDPQKIWQAALGELELMLSKANFTTWFQNTFILTVKEDTGEVMIAVPNAFTKSWMEQRYNEYIIKALNNVCQNKIKHVSYQIQTARQVVKPPDATVYPLSNPKQGGVIIQEKVDEFGFNKRYVFDNFVVGGGNELAYSASRAICEELGTRYNPLFLHGEVGLGKTHLMHAIGQFVRQNHQDRKVLYVNFEKFTNDYVFAARSGGFEGFRATYRGVDVLLVDDVQFMIDKEKTQDEFFHTFEELHRKNKQMVITSDRPPKALVELQDRMISRFEWGMIADIKMPDVETRIAILETKCKEKQFTLDRDIIAYLAESIKNNIRELEGALNKIIAWYELSRKTPTMTSVKDIVAGFLADPSKKALTPKRVMDAVAEFYSVSLDDILGTCRKRELVVPRQIAMYLMREELNFSFPTIGSQIGGRDHTTVMYACGKIGDMLASEERLRQEVENIKQRLYG